MAKKGRRSRADHNDDDDRTAGGGGGGGNIDALPDDHTVADSIATSFEGDFEAADDRNIDDLLSTSSGNVDHYNPTSEVSVTRRHQQATEVLSTVQDLLTEKRSAKREAGLRRIFRALSQHGSTSVVTRYQEDVHALCTTVLRGGSAAEQYAACRVLEVMAVVLGADHDDYYESYVEPLLKRIVNMTSRATLVRGAALRAMSVSNFICATDEESTEALLDLCEQVAAREYRQCTVHPTLRATALDCWALLATTIPEFYISGADENHVGRGIVLLPLVLECLDETSSSSASMDLRSSAGECMALIHEARLSLGAQLNDDTVTTTTERKFGQGGWNGSPQEDVFHEILQRISDLSNQSGHAISKKAKKEQRAAFRDYLATLDDGTPPEETVAFRGGTLSLNSWSEVIQLSFVRHCLQSGFQIQLLTNPTLQLIFGADGHVLNANGQLSQLEKRLIMSKTSEAAKNAHMDLTKKRRTRTNVKNHFLTADGEDL